MLQMLAAEDLSVRHRQRIGGEDDDREGAPPVAQEKPAEKRDDRIDPS